MSIDDENLLLWPCDFTCIIVSERSFIANNYSFKLSINPIFPIDDTVGTGFKKLRYFIDYQLNNSLFINGQSPYYSSIKDTETNLVVLPCEPYDYYVGSILLNKFLAITSNYFEIAQITVDSIVGDRIQYTLWDPQECGLDLDGDHWWNWDNPNTNSDDNTAWKDFNLKDNQKFEPTIIKGGLSENK